MADFKFKYCSYSVRVAASVTRRRDPSSHKATTGQGGLGNFFPRVALVEQISSLLSPEKAAEGETLRHMSRTTTTHAYHLPVQNPACAGARGAGGGVSTPAKKTQVLRSAPLIAPCIDGRTVRAAIIHDWLYSTAILSRKQAD